MSKDLVSKGRGYTAPTNSINIGWNILEGRTGSEDKPSLYWGIIFGNDVDNSYRIEEEVAQKIRSKELEIDQVLAEEKAKAIKVKEAELAEKKAADEKKNKK